MFFNNVFYGGIKTEGPVKMDSRVFGKKRRLSDSDSDSNDNQGDAGYTDDSNWPLGVLNDPNCMLGLIKGHVIGLQERGTSMFRDASINHWLYELKDEREIIQDLLLLLQGNSSNLFEIEERESGKFKLTIKKPLEMSHLSMVSLKTALTEFIDFQETKIFVTKSIEKWKKVKLRTLQRFFTHTEQFFNKYLTDIDQLTQIFALQTGLIRPPPNQPKNLFQTPQNLKENIILTPSDPTSPQPEETDPFHALKLDPRAHKPLSLLSLSSYIQPYTRSFYLLKIFFEKLDSAHNSWLILLKKPPTTSSENYNSFIAMTIINTLEELQKYIDIANPLDSKNFLATDFCKFFGVEFWPRICGPWWNLENLENLENLANYR